MQQSALSIQLVPVRRSNAEFQRFLQIATGSASELEYHFLLAKDLNFLCEEDY